MKNDKKIEDLLSESTGFEEKMLEKINESCNVLSDDQKNRVLNIIERKLAEENQGPEEKESLSEGESEEKAVRIIEHRRNISRILAPLAACICIVAGITFLNGRINQDVPPLDKPQITGEENVTDPAQTVMSDKEVIVPVTVTAEKNVSEAAVTVIVPVVSEGMPEVQSDAVNDVPVSQTEAVSETTEPIRTEVSETMSSAAVTTEVTDYFEYQVLYKELLDKLRFETEGISEVEYFLYDMNDDDVPELVTITGTCEADKTTSFYTIKNHHTVIAGENFRGDHSVIYVDERSGNVVIRNDWNAVGSITSYVFDGDKVTDSTVIQDYDLMDDPQGYEKEIEKLFSLRFDGYGIAYSAGSSILVSVNYENIKLNDESYYFTD